jgi:hypothetical protein
MVFQKILSERVFKKAFQASYSIRKFLFYVIYYVNVWFINKILFKLKDIIQFEKFGPIQGIHLSVQVCV